MILTYKYRIKDRSARKTLRKHAYAVNQVWNYCVAYQRNIEDRYRAGAPWRRWPSHFDLCYLTAGTSKELGISSRTINVICHQFAVSRNAAKHIPRFRASGGQRQALGWVPFQRPGRKIKSNSIIYSGKRYRFWEGNHPVPENAKGGCFVEDALGRWYVCFTIEVADDLPCGMGTVGIDLGLKALATCSDGKKVEAPQHFRRLETKLATAQRAGNKHRAKVIHAHIKNCRKDFIHKTTTRLANENQFIAVGNVNSARLAKTRMAKSVLDAGWSMFRSQLAYKTASRRQAVYLDIEERFTTQTCSQCGALPPERPRGIAGLGIRAWDCSECGASHDRDVNAAKNILALALSAQRHGDESRNRLSRQSDKHEPWRGRT